MICHMPMPAWWKLINHGRAIMKSDHQSGRQVLTYLIFIIISLYLFLPRDAL